MLNLELMGEPIYCCNKAEAGEIWRTRREDRHLIWLESEVKLVLLLGPDEIQRIAQQKKSQPGYTYKG